MKRVFRPKKFESAAALVSASKCWTRIVGKGRLWVTSFIYKYKTSTTYPLYETMHRFILLNK